MLDVSRLNFEPPVAVNNVLLTAQYQLITLLHSINQSHCSSVSTNHTAAQYQPITLLHSINQSHYCTVSTNHTAAQYQPITLLLSINQSHCCSLSTNHSVTSLSSPPLPPPLLPGCVLYIFLL